MFTGIIESLGTVVHVKEAGSNKTFTISSPISKELKIDQSISHNGVCLTVESCNSEQHMLTAIDETIIKSTLGDLLVGDLVNLERCLKVGDRLDGHFVQGHVDCTVKCRAIENKDGSYVFTFNLNEEHRKLVVSRGSITINGISLTIAELGDDFFQVAIIPYTFEHTNFSKLKVNQLVNIEFDILGKYILNSLNN